jgi:hypothetical protein
LAVLLGLGAVAWQHWVHFPGDIPLAGTLRRRRTSRNEARPPHPTPGAREPAGRGRVIAAVLAALYVRPRVSSLGIASL